MDRPASNMLVHRTTYSLALKCMLCERNIPAHTLVWLGRFAEGPYRYVFCSACIPANVTGISHGEGTGDDEGCNVVKLHVHSRDVIAPKLRDNWDSIYDLSASEFEQFVHDRFLAMGCEAVLTGATNQKDGGADIVFWVPGPVPLKGVVQVKHRRSPSGTVGSAIVRDFGGLVVSRGLNVGFIVTNSKFSREAKAESRKYGDLIKLRDGGDLKLWLVGDFALASTSVEVTELNLCQSLTIAMPDFL